MVILSILTRFSDSPIYRRQTEENPGPDQSYSKPPRVTLTLQTVKVAVPPHLVSEVGCFADFSLQHPVIRISCLKTRDRTWPIMK